MDTLTSQFIKISSRRERATEGDTLVREVFDLMRSGQVKTASQKLDTMTDEQVRELNNLIKQASDPDVGTVADPPNEVATGGDREVREETTPSTESRDPGEPGEPTAVKLKPGLDNKAKEQFSPDGPEAEEMKETPAEEAVRQPEGDSDQKEIKKTAADIFNENFRQGVRDGVEKIAALVKEKGSLNLAEEYSGPFEKIAKDHGAEAATEQILKSHSDGMKEAIGSLISNEEVRMGSLDKLREEQTKIASPEDLGAFARELGKQTILTKVANLQAMEAAALEAPPAEDAELMEAAAAVEALVDQAQNAPETLSDEEVEFLLQLSQEVEDQEAQLVGAEKVTTVVDYVAALRKHGRNG